MINLNRNNLGNSYLRKTSESKTKGIMKVASSKKNILMVFVEIIDLSSFKLKIYSKSNIVLFSALIYLL